MDTPYQIALTESGNELEKLVAERLKIDERINKLILSVKSLAHLLDDDMERSRCLIWLQDTTAKLRKPGLSQMISNVLDSWPKGLSPIEIRNVLVSSGSLDPKEYTNPSASIHTTLRRLVEAGEIEPKKRDGKKIFRRVPTAERQRRENTERVERIKKMRD